MIDKPSRKSFKMPDIYIVLVIFILLVAALTYLIPAGQFERQSLETANGVRTVVVPGTYHATDAHPAGFMDLVTAIPDGLKRAASVVFLTFMVGGCMGLLKRAGLIDMGVHNLIRAVGTKGYLVIPILFTVFSCMAAFVGTPELSLAYLPVLLPLFYRLGYDGMTATAVALLGPCTGFIFGLTIPSSIGLGQQIAEITLFSGTGFRAIVFISALIIAIAYVMRYAARVKAHPEKSLSLASDALMRAALSAENADRPAEIHFTARQRYAGIACLIMFPGIIFMILKNNLGFEAIGGLFLCMGIAGAAIAGKKPQEICDDVNAGMRDMMVASLICGVASAIAVVMDKGMITDTFVYWLESLLHSVPQEWTTIAIFWEQSLFNFLIPSASALTLLTMPVLSPLADLLDISRQAVVSANAWGGQLTDIFFPTSGFFVATLVIGKIEFGKWIRFYTPLMLIFGALASIALYLMQILAITF